MSRRATLRRVGPHPVRLGALIGHRLLEERRLRRLRRDYARIAGRPPAGARLRAFGPELGRANELPDELRGAAERLRAEARDVMAHRVDCLGSGPVELGPSIDWQRDFKSGHRWPAAFYQDVEVTRLDDDSDAKVPWELSRGHQLLTLARAAVLFEDEAPAAELEAQLAGWIEDNPPGVGINWVNPMEISLRAVNWLWAVGTLEAFRPLAPELRAAVTRSLQSHGRHVAANLEGSPLLRSNHYMADVLGLFALGLSLEGDPAARRWERTGRRALEREIVEQVHADGMDFEASLPYHGLVMEMLLTAWGLGQRAGRPLSERFAERLRRMLVVSRAVRHPGGRSPVIGDQDSGRVLPAGFARPATQDQLIDLGAALLGGPAIAAGAPHEEVAWNLGVPAWHGLTRAADRPAATPPAFPQGGLYVLGGGETHVVVRWGNVGQRGNGGHAHNDLGGYELSVGGVPLVVDCGTYVYTSDVEARDEFRSARSHNVLVVDGLDPHPIPRGMPFQLPALATFAVEAWEEGSRLVAGHDGYARQGAGGWCRRELAVDGVTGAVEIADLLEGDGGSHRLASYVHLAPGAEAERAGEGAVSALKDGRRVTIRFGGADAVEIEQGWVSESYGTREEAFVVKATSVSPTPARLAYRIEPTR